MKTFEIDKNFYKRDVVSIRHLHYVLIFLGLLFNGVVSIYKELGIIYFVFTSVILLVLEILNINFRFNPLSFCYKVILIENRVEFNFIHPFYKSKVVKKFFKKDLLVSLTKNHSLCTISFQKNSEIFISNLFEITNHINSWSEDQLKEILAEFK
jgi:hypothetical protein